MTSSLSLGVLKILTSGRGATTPLAASSGTNARKAGFSYSYEYLYDLITRPSTAGFAINYMIQHLWRIYLVLAFCSLGYGTANCQRRAHSGRGSF